jgi:hypothetical protein
MNLQVNTMSVFSSQFEREGRHSLELSVSMSRGQIKRAICTLLGHLSDQQAAHLLRSEFPELFTTEESTQ